MFNYVIYIYISGTCINKLVLANQRKLQLNIQFTHIVTLYDVQAEFHVRHFELIVYLFSKTSGRGVICAHTIQLTAISYFYLCKLYCCDKFTRHIETKSRFNDDIIRSDSICRLSMNRWCQMVSLTLPLEHKLFQVNRRRNFDYNLYTFWIQIKCFGHNSNLT